MQGTPTSRKSGSNAPYRPIKSRRRRALFASGAAVLSPRRALAAANLRPCSPGGLRHENERPMTALGNYDTLPRIFFMSAAEKTRSVCVRILPKFGDAQTKRCRGRVVRRFDNCDSVVLSERPEHILHGRSSLLSHLLESVRSLGA